MICIKNGLINDAVNREPYVADILVSDATSEGIGKILAIGPNLEVPGVWKLSTHPDWRCTRVLWRRTAIQALTDTELARCRWTITKRTTLLHRS